MNFMRVWAVVLRHLRLATEVNRLIWLFYWPLLDVVMWGFTGMWMQKDQAQSPTVTMSLLTGLVLWQLVGRASFEASINLIEEMWSFNMLNMFSSPLTLPEWLTAIFTLALLMVTAVTTYCMFLVWLLYNFNILSIGPGLIAFIPALFCGGMAMGFIATSFVIYFGARAQSLVFMLGWLFAPFAGAFYPVSVLPSWGRAIASGLPMTYAFTGIRELISSGILNWNLVAISTGMSVMYLAACLALFSSMFTWSKRRGFARLTAD